jgi:protein-histidine pros-kinase
LRKKYPDYAYKEATLNPTNPRDRATDWEADVINNFRNNPDQKELIGERSTLTGKYLFLAQPTRAGQPCLECHDTAQNAPEAMIRHYGAANGFGWKLNETIGAQILSVPFSVPVQMADRAFRNLMTSWALSLLSRQISRLRRVARVVPSRLKLLRCVESCRWVFRQRLQDDG